MTTLITGATGFVGRHLVARMRSDCRPFVTAVRAGAPVSDSFDSRVVGEVGPETDWTDALSGVDSVIHLAGVVHRMGETGPAYDEELERVNHLGTRRLLQACNDADVDRFVFMSTIKVLGEATVKGASLTSDQPQAPSDPYGESKAKAELAISEFPALRGVILRPPLVYGPDVGANFARLVRLVDRALPLPFGSIRNQRSLVSVRNLADFAVRCLDRRDVIGTYLVADSMAVSTPELVKIVAEAIGRPGRMFRFPPSLLKAGGALVGKADAVARLSESFVCDTASTRADFDWTPPYELSNEVAMAARSLVKRQLDRA